MHKNNIQKKKQIIIKSANQNLHQFWNNLMKSISLQFLADTDNCFGICSVLVFFFLPKNVIRSGVNLKLVAKFQVFCYTIKCTTLLRLQKSYTNLQTPYVWKQSRVTMGCHLNQIIALFLLCPCESLLSLFPYYKAQVHHDQALVFIIRHLFIIARHKFIIKIF